MDSLWKYRHRGKRGTVMLSYPSHRVLEDARKAAPPTFSQRRPHTLLNVRYLAIHEDEKIYSLVIDLMDPNTREGALLELSKKREQYDDLALVLWHSFGELYPHSDF